MISNTFQLAISSLWINGFIVVLSVIIIIVLLFAISVLLNMREIRGDTDKMGFKSDEERFKHYIDTLNSKQIEEFRKVRKKETSFAPTSKKDVVSGLTIAILCLISHFSYGQNEGVDSETVMSSGGVIITLILIAIPIIVGILLLAGRVKKYINNISDRNKHIEARKLADYIKSLPEDEIEETIERRQAAVNYQLSQKELSGDQPVADTKGLIAENPDTSLPFVAVKKKATKRPSVDPKLAKLVLWFAATATFWLIFGTSVGEYVGIKFVAPDIDQTSWLSFGRLRPVHTNSVFWGWASLGMLGLGYYSVPRVGNNVLFSYKLGWITLVLINATVLFGTIALMAGINNGGGEFREYIWPVMLPFAAALILTLYNFLKTIATRKTKEIYISNWYMVAALIFAIVITLVAYLPFWQTGLGETIVQGYYMHQGVGMWFMMFTLGIVYYYLPQQLNQPIYSYSLGILAYWTQILFYTLIGSHHFVFSSIPWWLQTVAIVGSVGMVIPVVAGTTNFVMTFKGAWHKITDSYTLPFFIVGIVFYFTGSMQGTAEAFRETNLYWHFTDFTVAHSHLTMYGIITFFIWAGMYVIIPRLTGKEPPQITVGAHFWMALIGLMFYSVPLMIGGTLRGLSWMEGKPFLDSVIMMAPHWLWRAIGGSLMWLSHLVFAYNLYKMWDSKPALDVKDLAIQKLDKDLNQQTEKAF
ncbi:cbb3-type cytochrome c oxidase subunit I [Albibacterium bauzanense]|uniref:Cytochrome c oxidase cbb3-type subunit 1 n=1 Tax=Albibacterium bauzanense TaxID=653929 RepID=A0A4R1M4S7_9SPHI|nr:cbb3-type cytochrome c oxidase subunit I [Albibacterium bauzanense]TCK84733.1 cytochrome c oxidase cbb3-type subunit 1 [Albibacterium bauzanense]